MLTTENIFLQYNIWLIVVRLLLKLYKVIGGWLFMKYYVLSSPLQVTNSSSLSATYITLNLCFDVIKVLKKNGIRSFLQFVSV